MYQTCHFGYEGHTHKCCSSIMWSKWVGGGLKPKAHFSSGKVINPGQTSDLMVVIVSNKTINLKTYKSIFIMRVWEETHKQ